MGCTYDPNSNRLTAIDSATSDTDLYGVFEAQEFTQATSQALNVDPGSNRLLGLAQTVAKTTNGKTRTALTTFNYALDANGAMTSDGQRTFEYDASRRLSKVRISRDGEAAKVAYLHNALGQRVFKSEVTFDQTLPDQATLGQGFVDWLKANFQWMFVADQASASVGTAFVYDEAGSLLGEYDNGSSTGKGRQEYIWLPTDDGQAIPIGIYRRNRFYAVHADHLGTPRLITDDDNKPVWQWPYSAFGNNKPTGVLKATPNPKAAITNRPLLLKATATGVDTNLRFPGQYFDEESNLNYNYFRSYSAAQGRYTQPDPIGIGGGLNRFGFAYQNPLLFTDPTGLTPPWWDIRYLPADLANTLTNLAKRVPSAAAAQATVAVMSKMDTVMFTNWAGAMICRAAAPMVAGYVGYQAGDAINTAIERNFGQNSGGALFDILHPN